MDAYYNGCVVPSREVLAPENIAQHLCYQINGIVLLDGYSGCGKTALLKKLRDTASRPVYLFSYENIVDKILQATQADTSCTHYLATISEECCIVGIEDVDYLRGREATQEYLAEMIQIAAKKHLVFLTGNNVLSKVPILCGLCNPVTFSISQDKKAWHLRQNHRNYVAR